MLEREGPAVCPPYSSHREAGGAGVMALMDNQNTELCDGQRALANQL